MHVFGGWSFSMIFFSFFFFFTSYRLGYKTEEDKNKDLDFGQFPEKQVQFNSSSPALEYR